MPLLESDFMNDVQQEAMATRRRTPPPAAPKKAGIEILHRASTKDLCRIARQLAALLHAGMPLVPAISALVEQLECPAETSAGTLNLRKKPLAEAIRHVRDDVNEGISLAEAMGKHPGVFSPLFVNMVCAGESSGALEEVLGRVADILEKLWAEQRDQSAPSPEPSPG
mgnify:CR=1 FL=1